MIFDQVVACICHVEVAMCVILTYANFCKFSTSLTMDVDKNLRTLSESVQTCSENSVANRHVKHKKEFGEIIQLHADSQQLSDKSLI